MSGISTASAATAVNASNLALTGTQRYINSQHNAVAFRKDFHGPAAEVLQFQPDLLEFRKRYGIRGEVERFW